jgi:tetratricopeptide (TPR) repeat protein
LSDEDCVAQVADAANVEMIPVGRLDFAEAKMHDGFEALLKLRHDLSGGGLNFPLFDFAVVTYLHKSKQLTDDRLRNIFPVEEIDFIVELASLVKNETPGVRLAVAFAALLDRRFGNWFQLHRQRRNLEDAHVEAIERMDHETDLVQELPNLFAQDLNAAFGDPGATPRVALFFDTHEAFWAHGRELEGDLYFIRDEWLRRLVGTLDRTAGIVVVLAGHEVPRWVAAPRWTVRDLEPRHVIELTHADADTYLESAGIDNPDLRERLCEDARVGPDQVHPYFLGLGADLGLAAARRGVALTQADLELGSVAGSRHQHLTNRFLRYVETEMRDAVAAVSTCRSFDRTIYLYLGQELHYLNSRAGFALLTGFSFVRRIEISGVLRFQLHELLRRLPLDPTREELKREAHVALERYYRRQVELGDESVIAEAIYHANRLDWQRGVAEWVNVFDAALRRSRYDLCRAFLGIRNELIVNSSEWSGRVSQCEAEYFQITSRYTEAEAEYEEAIDAFDQALIHTPDSPELHNVLGVAQHQLGKMYMMLSRIDKVVTCYEASIASYDRALKINPDIPAFHSNQGLVWQAIGYMKAMLNRIVDAEESYQKGIDAFGTALDLAPNDPSIHSNQGVALHRLGDLQMTLGPAGAAENSYRAAIAAFDHALDLASSDASFHNNQGRALQSLGNLLAKLSRFGEAKVAYQASIAAFDQALEFAPENPEIHDNKGLALQALGFLLVRSSLSGEGGTSYQQAEDNYLAAIAASGRGLKIAPDNPEIRGNQGSVLQRLGDLQAMLQRDGEAKDSYQACLSAYDHALFYAPDDPRLHCNRGTALLALGELQAELRRIDDAEISFQSAIAAYDRALESAVDDIISLNGRARANEYLCRLQLEVVGEKGRKAANYSLRAALTDIMHVLRLDPHNQQSQIVRQRIVGMLKEFGGDMS